MRKSFTIVFIINMAVRTITQGLLPLFPVITERVGASKQQNGYILAISYAMLLTATYLAGKLVPKYTQPKRLLLFSILPLCVCMGLIGYCHDILNFTAVTIIMFFFIGINTMASVILITQYSDQNSIGANFGILGLSNLLSSLLGGFIVGPVLFKLGYEQGFIVFGISLLVISCLVFFIKQLQTATTKAIPNQKILSPRFFLLLVSFVLAVMLIHVFLFSFSLSMRKAGYNISQISIYAACGAVVCLPFPYLFGKWVKRYNSKVFVLIAYGCVGTAILLLLLPKWTPTIVLAIALCNIMAFSGRVPVVTFTYSWFEPKDQPMVQAYLGTSAWLAAIIGYLTTGIILEHFGFTYTILYGIAISVISLIILGFFVKSPKR